MLYVERNEWDTVPATNKTPWDINRLLGGAVHWFGIPDGPNDHARCDDVLRGVRASHKNGEFNDIAYNHAACQHGFVFELRGFGFQSGANGFSDVNRKYYSIVYMTGIGDSPIEFTEKGQQALREIIHLWQIKGAGEAVTWHGNFTGSECPGPVIRPWVRAGKWKMEEEDDVDNSVLEWADDWLFWRVALNADPEKRPENVPESFGHLDPVTRQLLWLSAQTAEKISIYEGMSEVEEEWIRFRLVGGDRPNIPQTIPQPWWNDAKFVNEIADKKASQTGANMNEESVQPQETDSSSDSNMRDEPEPAPEPAPEAVPAPAQPTPVSTPPHEPDREEPSEPEHNPEPQPETEEN